MGLDIRNKLAKKDKEEPNAPDEKQLQLNKLKKQELLEIMLAQGEEIDVLRARVKELEAQLEDYNFKMSKIGSVAEASLQVTDIFREAEKAAKIYLENIRRRYE